MGDDGTLLNPFHPCNPWLFVEPGQAEPDQQRLLPHASDAGRQSVTAASTFPTTQTPSIVVVARLLRIVRPHLTPYLARHSEKPVESFPGSQNDSSEQSRVAESEYCFELRWSPIRDRFKGSQSRTV